MIIIIFIIIINIIIICFHYMTAHAVPVSPPLHMHPGTPLFIADCAWRVTGARGPPSAESLLIRSGALVQVRVSARSWLTGMLLQLPSGDKDSDFRFSEDEEEEGRSGEEDSDYVFSDEEEEHK